MRSVIGVSCEWEARFCSQRTGPHMPSRRTGRAAARGDDLTLPRIACRGELESGPETEAQLGAILGAVGKGDAEPSTDLGATGRACSIPR